jgi:hypothetical protein
VHCAIHASRVGARVNDTAGQRPTVGECFRGVNTAQNRKRDASNHWRNRAGASGAYCRSGLWLPSRIETPGRHGRNIVRYKAAPVAGRAVQGLFPCDVQARSSLAGGECAALRVVLGCTRRRWRDVKGNLNRPRRARPTGSRPRVPQGRPSVAGRTPEAGRSCAGARPSGGAFHDLPCRTVSIRYHSPPSNHAGRGSCMSQPWMSAPGSVENSET